MTRPFVQPLSSHAAAAVNDDTVARVLTDSGDIVVRYDLSLRRVWANRRFDEVTGLVAEQYLGRGVSEVCTLDSDSTQALQACLQRVLSSGRPECCEFQKPTANGEHLWLGVCASLERDVHGRPTGVITISRDIGEHKRAQTQLRERAREFRTLVEQSPDFIVRYNARGERTYVNPAVRKVIGATDLPEGATPRSGSVILELELYQQLIDDVLSTGMPRGAEVRAQRADGSIIWLDMRVCPETDEHGRVVSAFAIGRDISASVELREAMHSQATSDSLTALNNRQALYEHGPEMLAEAARRGGKVGAMLLDIDRFKEVNDTLGHGTGDALLREFARRLRETLRDGDLLVRLGGDEFALLVPQLRDGKGMVRVAEKILRLFAQAFDLANASVFASASIGVAMFPRDGDNLDALLAHADTAMYEAKRSGRGRYAFYQPAFSQRANERLVLEQSLRGASAGEGLSLVFQPKLRLKDNRLAGAEALLRWRHPTLGLVSPDRFIPIAEDTGLIVPIGRWVIKAAVETIARWNRGRREPLRLAINVSSHQFTHDELVKVLRKALDAARCDPQWLEIEVTESVLIDNSDRVRETMQALRAMGITVAIDDFGTGYSALSYLSRFDVSCLKIDRQFVRDIEREPRQRELLKAFIAMAKALNLDLVAEGVETADQADFLRGSGCAQGQGYLFSPPLAAEAFERDWLADTSSTGFVVFDPPENPRPGNSGMAGSLHGTEA